MNYNNKTQRHTVCTAYCLTAIVERSKWKDIVRINHVDVHLYSCPTADKSQLGRWWNVYTRSDQASENGTSAHRRPCKTPDKEHSN